MVVVKSMLIEQWTPSMEVVENIIKRNFNQLESEINIVESETSLDELDKISN